jgi:hypothetical protein
MSNELDRIDSQTTALASRCDSFVYASEGYECNHREAFVLGAERLREIKTMQKTLEERRTSITVPLNEALRTLNAWFKGPQQKLGMAEQTYKNKMATFEAAERERIRREEEAAERRARAEREELERRALAAIEKGQEEKAETLLARASEVVPQPPETAPLKAAGMGFGEMWEFTIIDAALLPREYLQPDMVKIGQYVRAMKADAKIPGVRTHCRPKVSARAGR